MLIDSVDKSFKLLENKITAIKRSYNIIEKVSAFLKRKTKTKDNVFEQSFYYDGEEMFYGEKDFLDVDNYLKRLLREDISLTYKHGKINKSFVESITEKLTLFFNDYKDKETVLGSLLATANTSKKQDLLIAFYIQTIIRILSNEFKDAYLRNENKSDGVYIKQNVLSLALGNGLISVTISPMSMDPKFTRQLKKKIQEYDTISALLKGIKPLKKKQVFKDFKEYNNILRLIVHQFLFDSFHYLKENIDKPVILKGPSGFGRILSNFKDLREGINATIKESQKFLEGHGKSVGEEIIVFLIANEFLEKEQTISTKKDPYKSFNLVACKNFSLLFSVSRYLTRFSSLQGNTFTLKESSNLLIALHKYKSNFNIKETEISTVFNLKHNKDKMENVCYKINYEFLAEFLELFVEILNTESEDILKNKLYLQFLSELYGINLYDLYHNNEQHKDYFLQLVSFLTTFDEYDISESPVKSIPLKGYYVLSKTIFSTCLNKKFIISELLFQLNITSRFKFFFCDYFYDFRGRVYPLSSILNPYVPLVRNFISFYCAKPLISLEKHDINKQLMLEQLTTLLIDEKAKIIYPTSLKDTLLLDNLKFDNRFAYFNIAIDCLTYDNKPFGLRHFYSIDARNSGFQCTAMLTSNRSLAQDANLLFNKNKEDKDLYTRALAVFMTFYDKQKEILSKIPQLTVAKFKHKFANIGKIISDVSEPLRQAKKEYFQAKTEYSQHKQFYTTVLKKSLPIDDPKRLTLNEKRTALRYEKETLNENKINAVINFFITLCQDKEFIPELNEMCNSNFDFTIFEHLPFKRKVKQKIKAMAKAMAEGEPIPELLAGDLSNITLKKLQFLYCFYYYLKFMQLLDNPLILSRITRKFIKRPFMTASYGVTLNGASKQLLESFIDSYFDSKTLLSDKLYRDMKFLCGIVAKCILPWIHKTFPKAMKFLELVQRQCRLREFNHFVVKNPYFSYTYEPLLAKVAQMRIGKKLVRVSVRTNEVDYKRLSNAYVANFIQFCDAYICTLFVKMIKNQSFFTIHDRWFISPYNAFELRNLVKKAYLQFSNTDLITYNFKDDPIFMSVIENDPTLKFSFSELQKDLETIIFVKP